MNISIEGDLFFNKLPKIEQWANTNYPINRLSVSIWFGLSLHEIAMVDVTFISNQVETESSRVSVSFMFVVGLSTKKC